MSRGKGKHETEHDEDDVPAAVAVNESESAEESTRLEEPQGSPGPESEIESLRRKAEAMRDLAQRKQAEFENYRRRMERERAELARYAGFDFVKEVLPVLDNLERAIQASKSSPEETFRAGVEIIHRQFQEILTRLGLDEVASEGKPFDPHVHEAVTRVTSDEHPDGTVVEVFQRGYLFRDRLLRPAMVSVAQTATADPEERNDDARDAEPDDTEEAAPGPD